MPECYLTLLENLDDLLDRPLTFISTSRYPAVEVDRQGNRYPVATLGDDVELHFMHAESQGNAESSWLRRLGRLDRRRLYVKMCDRDGCTAEHIHRFARLPYERKVCFVSREYPGLKDVVHIAGYEQAGELPTDLIDRVDATFDTAYWLRTGRHRLTPRPVRMLHGLLLGHAPAQVSGLSPRSALSQ